MQNVNLMNNLANQPFENLTSGYRVVAGNQRYEHCGGYRWRLRNDFSFFHHASTDNLILFVEI